MLNWSNETSENDCDYQPPEWLDEKFLIVGVLGTAVSLIGMVLNGLAAYTLARLVHRRPTALVYLLALALLDFLFCCEYILMLTNQVYFDYFHNFHLFIVWHRYLPLVFALSKMIQTASTYLIVAASLERFIDSGGICGLKGTCAPHQRLIVIGAVLLLTILFRIISYWEVDIISNPYCEGFASLAIERSQLSQTQLYKYYSLHTVNIVQVFLPFSLLLCLNAGIIYRLRIDLRTHSVAFRRGSVMSVKERWEKAKDLILATRMLICVVTTYLVSNILSVVITFMEHFEMDFLQANGKFYTISVDLISLLYVFTSSTRFLIYVACSRPIRDEMARIHRSFCPSGKGDNIRLLAAAAALHSNSIAKFDTVVLSGSSSFLAPGAMV